MKRKPSGETSLAPRDGDASPVLSEEKPDPAAAPESEATLADLAGKPAPEKVTYSMSPGLSGFLGANKIGLAISSYQSGKFYLLGQNVPWTKRRRRLFARGEGIVFDRDGVPNRASCQRPFLLTRWCH